MKKSILFKGIFCLLLLITLRTFAQTTGDYRTAASGNWNTKATWQVRTGANAWVTATSLPTSTSAVFIQYGHTVTLDATGTSDGVCSDLNISTGGILAISSSYNVQVNGKIRAFTTTSNAVYTTTSADGSYTGTSTTSPVSTMITTGSTGVLKFVGTTRTLTNSGEWGPAGGGSNVEFALSDNTQTVTLSVGIKFKNIILTTGIVSTGSFISIGNGTTDVFQIKTGAKFSTSRSSANGAIIGNSSGAKGTKLQIDAGGTLELSGAAPTIDITSFSNNGTVNYTGTTQSLLANGTYGTVTTSTLNAYTNLFFSGTGTKSALSDISVSGTLNVSASGSVLDMGIYNLSGGFTCTNAGTIQTSSTNAAPFPSNVTWGTTTGTITYALLTGGQTVVAGNYYNLTISSTSGNTTLASSGTIGVAGTFTPGTGTSTYTNTGSTINFNGASAQTIPVFSYFNLTNSGTSSSLNTLGGTINVADTFTIAGSKLLTAGSGSIAYGASVGTLVFSGTTSLGLSATSPEWPASSGPTNIVVTSNIFSFTASAGITRTVTGDFKLNGGNFTVNTGNTLNFANGSSATKLTNNNFNATGGTYVMGVNTSDVVTVNIGSATATGTLINTSSEAPTSPNGVLNLNIFSGFTYYLTSTSQSTVTRSINNLTLNGTLGDTSIWGRNLTVKGNISGKGTYAGRRINSSKITMSGKSTAATIDSVTFNNLELSSANGFTLSNNPTVRGSLILTNGVVSTTTSYKMTIADTGAVTRTSGWVYGNLQKGIATAGTTVFEVGDASSNYTPASLVVSSTGFAAGNVAVTTISGISNYANIGTLSLNSSTNYLNRYWTVSQPSGSSFAGTYTGTFTYVGADSIGTRTKFRTAYYKSTAWAYPGAPSLGIRTITTPAGMTTGSTFVFADPISLSIKANDQTNTYGTNKSLGTTAFTTTGLLSTDAITNIALKIGTSTSSLSSDDAGTYAIVPSPPVGFDSSNYAISYLNGTMTVNKAPLTVTARDTSKTYGNSITITNYNVTGTLYNGDTITSVSFASNGQTSAATVGTYSITPSSASGTGSSNYTFSYTNGNLKVDSATLTITASNNSKIAGNTLTLGTSSTGFTYTGLANVNNDSIATVVLTSAGSGSSATAGTYPIVPSSALGSGLNNYKLIYKNGTLTVSNLTAQTITFNSITTPLTYGASSFNLSATATSNLGVTFVSSDTSVAKISGNTVTIVGAGNTVITASQAGDGTNYAAATDVTQSLVVNKKALTITGLTGIDKVYNASTNASFSGTPQYVGLQNGDTSSVKGTPTASFTSSNVVAGGSTIIVTGYTSPNNNYTLTPDTLTANITPAALTISGLSGTNKVADGTKTATLSGTPSLVGVYSVDNGNVTLNGSSVVANFTSASVGNAVSISVSGYTLTGSAASNYSVTQPSGLTANITYPTTFYFVTASADITDKTNWWSKSDGTGINPQDFVTDGITYQVNASTTTSSPWTVSGNSSKIKLGNGANTVNLTVAALASISNSSAPMDINASSSLIWKDSLSQPTIGTLSSTSEVHYQANLTITSSLTYGKVYFDGVGKTVTINSNPVVQTALVVGANSTLSFANASTVYAVMNAGASDTIKGLIKITKLAGFYTFGINSPSSGYGTFQFYSTETAGTLVLSNGSTVEYARTNANTTQTIAARTDYKNLTISDGSSPLAKTIAGPITVAGTLTVNQSFASLTAGGNITVNGVLALTAGTLDMSTYQLLGSFTSSGSAGTLKTSNTSTSPIPSGITWASGTTVNYAANGQTIVKGNYGSLSLVGASNITFPSSTDTLGISSTFNPSSISSTGNSTINFNNNTGKQTIPSCTYNNVVISNASNADTLVSSPAIVINGALTYTTGKLLYPGRGSISYGNNATLNFNGSNAYSIQSSSPEWQSSNTPNTINVNANTSFAAVTTSYSFSSLQLTSNVATLTTSTPHNFTVGQFVTIGGFASASTFMFNGSYQITSVSGSSFSFNRTNADVALNTTTSSFSNARVAASNISRTITGNLVLAATFTVNAGNLIILTNGSTVVMNSSAASLGFSGGCINNGTTSTDLVNVTINAGTGNSVNVSGELSGVPNPGAYGTLTVTSGKYVFGASRTVTTLINNDVIVLPTSSTATATLTVNGNISGTGTLTGSKTSSLSLNGDANPSGTFKFTSGSDTLSSLTINRTGLGSAVVLGSSLKLVGNLLLTAGTLADGGNTITLNGNISGTGKDSGTGKIVMMGSTQNTISGATLNNLEINNASGVFLTGSPSINGVLTLTSGIVTSSSKTRSVILTSTGSIVGASSSTGWINGFLQKNIKNAGITSFEIGNATNYLPTSLTIPSSGFAAGDLKVSTNDSISLNNNISTLSLDTNTNAITRYWSVVSPSTSSFAGTYSATFNYLSSDLKGSTTSLRTAINTGSSWNYLSTPSNPALLQISTPAGITPTTSGDIIFASPTSITVAGITASKVYDGLVTATPIFNSASLNGVINSNVVTLNTTSSTAVYDTQSVGTSKTLTISGLTLNGSDANAYTLTQPSILAGAGTITTKTLTVTGATATSKVYDGTTTASITGATLVGVVSPDVVTLSGGGSFATKAIGTSKTVTAALTLGGADAGNYSLTQTSGLTANITAKALTVTGITPNNKHYDGTTAATLSGIATLSGLITNDNVTLGGTPIANFTSANFGYNIPVTVTGYTVAGTDLSNYSFSQPTGLTANITGRPNTWSTNVGNWDIATNWEDSVLPANGSSVTIASGMPILSSNKTVANINIFPGAKVDLNGDTLFITGAVSGTGTLKGSSTSTVVMNSSSNNTLYFGTGTDSLLKSLVINGTGTTTIGSGLGITSLLNVNSGTLNANGKLGLKSTSIANTALVGNVTGTITGKATVERFIPQGLRAYRDLCPEVANAGSVFANWQEGGIDNNGYGIKITGTSVYAANSGVDATTGFDYTSFNTGGSMYTDSNGIWSVGTSSPFYSSVSSTKNLYLNPYAGYRVLIRGDRSFNLFTAPQPVNMTSDATLRATGNLVTGTVTYSSTGVTGVYSSGYGLTSGANSYSLIGNPYVAPIDWSTVKKTGLTSSYWDLDPTFEFGSTYVTYNAVSQTNSNPTYSKLGRYIQPGQAFFVQNSSSATTSQLVISETDKQVDTALTSVFGNNSSPVNRISIAILKNNKNVDGAVAVFNNNFTKSYGDEDSRKASNGGENLSITEGTNDLSIDGLSNPTTSDVINLKLVNMKANTPYNLSLNVDEFNGNGVQAYLKDSYNNTETLLNGTTNVAFIPTSAAATYSNRFSIIFKKAAPLFISSIHVKAQQKAEDVLVNWTVTEETKVTAYEVQISSNGKEFTGATTVKANNTGSTSNYSWSDTKAATLIGTHYYRIKTIGMNGEVSYSQVVEVVINSSKGQITIYPNPVKGSTIGLELTNLSKATYTAVLYNNLGQQIISKTIQHNGGSATVTIDLGKQLSAGIYSLKVVGNNGTSYEKEVIGE